MRLGFQAFSLLLLIGSGVVWFIILFVEGVAWGRIFLNPLETTQ